MNNYNIPLHGLILIIGLSALLYGIIFVPIEDYRITTIMILISSIAVLLEMILQELEERK